MTTGIAGGTGAVDWPVVRWLLLCAFIVGGLRALEPGVMVLNEIYRAEAERLGCYTVEEWNRAKDEGRRCR